MLLVGYAVGGGGGVHHHEGAVRGHIDHHVAVFVGGQGRGVGGCILGAAACRRSILDVIPRDHVDVLSGL